MGFMKIGHCGEAGNHSQILQIQTPNRSKMDIKQKKLPFNDHI